MIMPHSVDLERAVLGAMLFEQEAIDLAMEQITADVFYKPHHALIFSAICRMSSEGTPVDQLTLTETIRQDGALEKIGGEEVIAGLVGEITGAANIVYHCQVLLDKYNLRRIIALSCGTRAQCEEGVIDAAELAAQTISQLTAILDQTKTKPYQDIKDAVTEAYQRIVKRAAAAPGVTTGVPSGFRRLDRLCDGWNECNLIVLGGLTKKGKTTLMLNFLLHAARNGYPVGMFSLEMSISELMGKLLTMQSGVNAADVQYHPPTSEQWKLLADVTNSTYNLPVVMDDTPGISLPVLAAKARKMQRDRGIRMVIVDYLQLMEGSNKENRQLEVASISRGLKHLSKQMKVPVMAISQFSRKANESDFRRPRLSDLRECVAIDTAKIYLATNTQSIGISDSNVVSLNTTNGECVMNEARYIPKTNNTVFRLKTVSGRFVDATANHYILTSDGFKKMSCLSKDDSVATVINFGGWDCSNYIPESKFIGWMLGNGSMIGTRSPSFITNDECVAKEFCSFVVQKWGFVPKPHPHKCKKVFQYDLTYCKTRTARPNVVKTWCIEHDLWGRTAKDKYIPEWLMGGADKKSIIELLSGLWETDGSVDLGKCHKRFSYSTTSEVLKDQIVYLLAKIGIFSTVDDGYLSSKATIPCYKVVIENSEFCLKFNELIKMTGYKGDKQKVVTKTRSSYYTNVIGSNTSKKIDGYIHSLCPRSIARIQTHGDRKTTKTHLIKNINAVKKHTGITETPFDWLCSESIVWDSVKSITPIGEKEVFDLSVNNTHNFVVNGIVVHNSGAIEQDADLIMFLHDPSPDEKQTLSGGYDCNIENIRELIVEANRHGRSGTLPIWWDDTRLRYNELDTTTITPLPSNIKRNSNYTEPDSD